MWNTLVWHLKKQKQLLESRFMRSLRLRAQALFVFEMEILPLVLRYMSVGRRKRNADFYAQRK